VERRAVVKHKVNKAMVKITVRAKAQVLMAAKAPVAMAVRIRTDREVASEPTKATRERGERARKAAQIQIQEHRIRARISDKDSL
jgi:hypothetical protein